MPQQMGPSACTFCRYMPILPTVLVNGAEGIGTGWSTYVPNYNPKDIAENLKVGLIELVGAWSFGEGPHSPMEMAHAFRSCPWNTSFHLQSRPHPFTIAADADCQQCTCRLHMQT